jgi:hypothetical protein
VTGPGALSASAPPGFASSGTSLDPRASEAGKTEGMLAAEANAPAGWIDQAVAAIRLVARRAPFFTSDDVWAVGLEHPHEARALGPCLARARALGLVEPTDQFVLTSQVKRHRAPVRVWKSLLFQDPNAPWTRKRVEAYVANVRAKRVKV